MSASRLKPSLRAARSNASRIAVPRSRRSTPRERTSRARARIRSPGRAGAHRRPQSPIPCRAWRGGSIPRTPGFTAGLVHEVGPVLDQLQVEVRDVDRAAADLTSVVYEIAWGRDGSPYGQLAAVDGLAYIAAIALLRARGRSLSERTLEPARKDCSFAEKRESRPTRLLAVAAGQSARPREPRRRRRVLTLRSAGEQAGVWPEGSS